MRNKHFILIFMLLMSLASHAQKKTIITDALKAAEIYLNGVKITTIISDTALVGATDLQVPTAKAVKTYVLNHSGPGGGGDDWGAQSVATNATLSGNGLSGTELGLADDAVTATKIATGAVDLASVDVTGTAPVNKGGTGASTLTGYVKGTGTSPLTGVALIPESDISNDAILARVSSTESIAGNWTFLGTGTTFRDNCLTLSDNGDNSKLVQFQASSVSAGTTRTLTVQNKNYTIAGTDDAAGGDATGTLGALTVAKIQGKTIPAPVAGDDLKLIQYNHTSGQFQYVVNGGGADNWGS